MSLRLVACLLFWAMTAGVARAETVQVVVDRSTIWNTVSGVSFVLTVVKAGTVLNVRERQGRWCIVELPTDPSKVGYILADQLGPAFDPPPAPVVTTDGSEQSSPPETPAMAHQHQGMDMGMGMSMASGWQFMQDGVLFGMYNDQGGPRGGEEFKFPNWWMGMLTRKVGPSQITLNSMFSFDYATLGKEGYRELFQSGEALDDKPIVDHQHPHDFLMQLAAVWRLPLGSATGVTIAGGPSGEPALGPVAFMHRASAAEDPFAPLSHHTFDSTHVAFGVVTAAVDHGPWVVEASAFNGREPDDYRWDFDFGRLDSFSGRVWLRPSEQWEFQVSSGRLKEPEQLEPGDITRTTASAGWFKQSGGDFTAVTAAYGMNATAETDRHAVLVEGTHHWGRNSLFARAELVDVETSVLLNDTVPSGDDAARKDAIGAFTIGGVRDVFRRLGFEAGLGAAVTFDVAPQSFAESYGSRPVSFQVYFRLRPPSGSMGRMWNMRMSQPTKTMAPMMGHQM